MPVINEDFIQEIFKLAKACTGINSFIELTNIGLEFTSFKGYNKACKTLSFKELNTAKNPVYMVEWTLKNLTLELEQCTTKTKIQN